MKIESLAVRWGQNESAISTVNIMIRQPKGAVRAARACEKVGFATNVDAVGRRLQTGADIGLRTQPISVSHQLSNVQEKKRKKNSYRKQVSLFRCNIQVPYVVQVAHCCEVARDATCTDVWELCPCLANFVRNKVPPNTKTSQ